MSPGCRGECAGAAVPAFARARLAGPRPSSSSVPAHRLLIYHCAKLALNLNVSENLSCSTQLAGFKLSQPLAARASPESTNSRYSKLQLSCK